MDRPLRTGKIEIHLIWFDSMGAKSSSILIETPDLKLLVDPGVAALQPGYPLPAEKKEELKQKAMRRIIGAARIADELFISHYHYDHHTLPEAAPTIYRNKRLWVKDPNQWLNLSQWQRARRFLNQLYHMVGGDPERLHHPPPRIRFSDPLDHLCEAKKRNFGNYQPRRQELLNKGRRWWQRVSKVWQESLWVGEFSYGGVEVRFADGRKIQRGRTKIRFTPPLFHGIEYDRLGWVIGLVVEYGRRKILYSSDLQGPQIEDYAQWIIKENPDLIILDGPATYLFGFMMNRINLRRAIENFLRIIKETKANPIIYDHHNLRDPRYRERLKEVYEEANRSGKRVITAAEWLNP
ncbi:MBL fold metallo-hydrolase [candidate division WOR-3 bacterium]|uniref:MBL fold metallo-hydrolase n=1 Tax=candidate division WOR-3 bacterium TaxID=2052148 RepID=A0A660SJA5_UNCW3|nr:MAG: MBL fold metallo-hydrolase [candidate division WOR-3 bacterium]